MVKWAWAMALALLVTPAWAAPGWMPYGNARFGYWIDVPPGFSCDPESDNSDGRVCHGEAGKQQLTVWGGYTDTTDGQGFAGEASSSLDADKQSGWTVTYQASAPSWASYSGTKGQRVLYARLISGCKGQQYAAFDFEYPSTEINKLKPVVERLVSSLTQQTCRE